MSLAPRLPSSRADHPSSRRLRGPATTKIKHPPFRGRLDLASSGAGPELVIPTPEISRCSIGVVASSLLFSTTPAGRGLQWSAPSLEGSGRPPSVHGVSEF